jgi:hypothetical protein
MHTAAKKTGALAAFCAASLFLPAVSLAGATDEVASPSVQEGEREIDFKAGTAKLRDGTRESAYSLGFGWAVNRWWFTELSAVWNKEPGLRHSFDAWEWENRFQLTETGKYPVDVGFLLEIERPKDRSQGYEYKWGPLLQADIGSNVQANLNILVEKRIRASTAAKAELGYQWQVKYRWHPEFEAGPNSRISPGQPSSAK